MAFMIPILMSMLESLLSKNLFATLLCEGLRKWADWENTANDERIVDAFSNAWGVDSTSVKELALKKQLEQAKVSDQ